MYITVPIAMFGWPMVVLFFFLYLPPRRAVICSMLGAWMFLPMAGYSLPGFPDITKMSITCVSVLVAAMIFDFSRLTSFRWRWADLFLSVWILVPIPSSMLAAFGFYDGISGAVNHIISWGLPYLIGRLYFSEPESLNDLAISFFLAGLVYLPFVLFEVRMSPQLHTWIYGFYQHTFGQSKRGGGFRPTLFMQHGLAVAIFMATASVCGGYLAYRKLLEPIYLIPAWIGVLGVIIGTILCKSSYSILLMIVGISVLIVSTKLKSRLLMVGLTMVAPIYIFARTFGKWNAQMLRDAASLYGDDRSSSLRTRLDSEDVLWKWVQGNVVFGRGGIGQLLQVDQYVLGQFIPDGFWLIVLGKYGIVGLVSIFGMLLVPAFVYLTRLRPQTIFAPRYAGATCLGLILVMYALDNLLNAMLNPMYMLAAGGLIAVRDHRSNSSFDSETGSE